MEECQSDCTRGSGLRAGDTAVCTKPRFRQRVRPYQHPPLSQPTDEQRHFLRVWGFVRVLRGLKHAFWPALMSFLALLVLLHSAQSV